MNRQVQAAGLNLLLNALFHCFGITYDAKKSIHRHVPMDQRFGLIAFELRRVVRVSLEVAPLQQGPVDLV